MKITVTRFDIISGEPQNPCNCPIARALNRKLKTGYKADVGPSSIKIRCCDTHRKVSEQYTPDTAKEFIFDIDHGIEVEPITFELEYIKQYFKETRDPEQLELF